MMQNQSNDEILVNTMNIDHHLKKIHEEVNNLADAPSSQITRNKPSQQLEALKNALKEASVVNNARVLYFKAEITLGNYQIHDDKIAMNMLYPMPA